MSFVPDCPGRWGPASGGTECGSTAAARPRDAVSLQTLSRSLHHGEQNCACKYDDFVADLYTVSRTSSGNPNLYIADGNAALCILCLRDRAYSFSTVSMSSREAIVQKRM